MLKEVSIEIIRKCPNHCLHCSSSSHLQCTEEMPYEKFKEVVSNAVELGAKTICLSGGEPFLHDRIRDIIQFVYSCGLDCYVYTSGIILDESGQLAPLSAEVLDDISVSTTKLVFNIEAGTEKTYDTIMGTVNCFGKMQRSVIRAFEAGICIEAHFVPTKLNVGEINEVIALCEKLHISKVSFLRLVPHGRAKQNKALLELSAEEHHALKHALNTLQAQSGLSIRIGVPLSLDTSCCRCEAANGKLNIRFDGAVFPCEVFKNCQMKKSLGKLNPDSIYDHSLIDTYNNSPYLKYVRELLRSFADIQQCETCVGQYLIQMDKKEGSTI